MKKENLLKTSTHTKRLYRNMMKEKRGEKKLMKRKTQGEMCSSRVLVFIPRAKNSSRKLRGCMDVPGK